MPATEKTGLLGGTKVSGDDKNAEPTLSWRILFYVNGEMLIVYVYRRRNIDVNVASHCQPLSHHNLLLASDWAPSNKYFPLFPSSPPATHSVFFSCVSFSIILPSLQPYLSRNGASSYFYGSTVAIYSVGEMVGAMLFGKVYERMTVHYESGAKTTLLMTIMFGMVGSAFYVLGDVVSSPNMIFLGRALQGLWTGGKQVVEQTYLSETAPPHRVTELREVAHRPFVDHGVLIHATVSQPDSH